MGYSTTGVIGGPGQQPSNGPGQQPDNNDRPEPPSGNMTPGGNNPTMNSTASNKEFKISSIANLFSGVAPYSN